MDGLGFRLVSSQRDGAEIFAAWVAMLEVASHGEPSRRGWLVRDGLALTPKLLAVMTGFKERIFKRAMEFFTSSEARWLEVVELPAEMASESDPSISDQIPDTSESNSETSGSSPDPSGCYPDEPGDDPDEVGPKNRTEGNRTEGNRREGERAPKILNPDSEVDPEEIRPAPGSPGNDPGDSGGGKGSGSKGVPTAKEIFSFSNFQGYPTDIVQDFIDYWESESWMTRNGNSLGNGRWKSRLSKWVRESIGLSQSKAADKTNGHLSPQMERRAAEYDEQINVPILKVS